MMASAHIYIHIHRARCVISNEYYQSCPAWKNLFRSCRRLLVVGSSITIKIIARYQDQIDLAIFSFHDIGIVAIITTLCRSFDTAFERMD